MASQLRLLIFSPSQPRALRIIQSRPVSFTPRWPSRPCPFPPVTASSPRDSRAHDGRQPLRSALAPRAGAAHRATRGVTGPRCSAHSTACSGRAAAGSAADVDRLQPGLTRRCVRGDSQGATWLDREWRLVAAPILICCLHPCARRRPSSLERVSRKRRPRLLRRESACCRLRPYGDGAELYALL